MCCSQWSQSRESLPRSQKPSINRHPYSGDVFEPLRGLSSWTDHGGTGPFKSAPNLYSLLCRRISSPLQISRPYYAYQYIHCLRCKSVTKKSSKNAFPIQDRADHGRHGGHRPGLDGAHGRKWRVRSGCRSAPRPTGRAGGAIWRQDRRGGARRRRPRRTCILGQVVSV